MRYPAFLLMMLAVLSTSAQNTAKDFKRFQIGINVSPDLCYRTLKNKDGSASSDLVIQTNNENEVLKLGYTAGLNLCVNLNSSFGLETGIQYSNKGYQTRLKELVFPVPEPEPTRTRLVYNLHYLDIPVKASFTFGSGEIRFFASVGVTTNVFISAGTTSVVAFPDRTTRVTSPDTHDYNQFTLSPTLSFGLDCPVSDKLSLRVEPTFRYGVMEVIDQPVTAYLYSGGLNIGCYFGS